MAGYIGSKAVLLSTTAATVTGAADIGGDLTVDTNTLYVDSTNNRVGIGVSSVGTQGDLYIGGSGNSDDVLIGLSPTNSTGGQNPLSQIGASADGTYGSSLYFNTRSTGGTVAERLRIDSSGNVGIGTSSIVSYPKVTIYDASTKNPGFVLQNTTTGQTSNDGFFVGLGVGGSGDANTAYLYHRESGPLVFATNNTERMRIDSSGNLLVGTTSSSIAYTTNSGAIIYPDGSHVNSRNGGICGYYNRITSDGDIVVFNKSGTTVGSIGTLFGDIYLGTGNTGLKFTDSSSVIVPFNTSTASERDNAIDLGQLTTRFDDVYATNGTIQTSDANEKQDIAELDEAEKRVAVAAKGLIRKYRWKDAVAEKGDDARIHVGIIAQDLQAAFAAEGLDAGRYAMFISSTWWEADEVIPAVEAVEAVDAIYEDVVIPAVLDEEGNEVEPERTEQRLVSEAIEAVEAQPERTVTHHYETAEEAPEGATERTRLGVRYPELLAFIIGAM